ncbi:MAG: hybrid sensor histidine kinase/response regulator, partial [Terriglobales bacterium]
VGRLRDGQLRPSAEIVDICLEAVDTLKKFLYRQWPDDGAMKAAVNPLLARIARLAPEEGELLASAETSAVSAPASEESVPAEAQSFSHQSVVAPSFPAVSQPAPASVAPAEAALAADAAASGEAAVEGEATLAGKKELAAMPQSKSVRIALERLDRMMNAVGELVINRTRMMGRVAELERLADILNFSKGRMSEKVSEFQEKHEFSRLSSPLAAPAPSSYPAFGSSFSEFSSSADPDFSELEMDRYDDFNILSRSLTEISADITEVLTQLGGFVRRVDSDIDEFSKLAHRLQDEITQARMVPIGNLYTRISRTARDAAKASGKPVELTLAGAETELDNNIIQQISDPLVHLVRNAVAHGLEKTEDRLQAGKDSQGNVAVRAYHRGNHIYIEVEDDGRGIDYARVRNTAVEAGLVAPEDAESLAERDLLEFLFHPGFSTAPKKTELAGRGVGLDVVRANLAALNGEVDIETELGKGTRFTLKVPLTLIISQALFVRCGVSTFALPLSFVEEIRRLNQTEIEEVGGKLLTRVRGVVTEVLRLDSHLGLDPVEPVNGWYRLVIVNVAGRHVGLVVEEVIRKDEIVIKGLGDYLRNVKLFPGATIAPDGALILLIDVNRLVAGESIERRPLMTTAAARVFAPGATAVAAGAIPAAAVEAVPAEKIVVLADDSISVRKFVGRMLEKAGYRVRLASDGLEALEIATQNRCDLLVTDLEMPRTNGYELMAHLRQDAATRSLPVMVVTSRAGAKHRERALKEGASAFMTKPVQEDMFLAAIADLIGPAVAPATELVMETVS